MAERGQYSTEQVVEEFLRHGTIAETARQLACHRKTVQHHLKKAGMRKPIAAGLKEGMKTLAASLPKDGEVKRYILTCAQNNTWVNKGVWENLLALAEHYAAEIKVSRFAYNLQGFQPAKPDAEVDQDRMWYDPVLTPYISDDRVELAPTLVWCGEMNILPTATRPLSLLETYTGTKSSVIPHVKIAMESIANNKYEATKFTYTTGTVTKLNYIQKKAGLKAEFHHCFGALLVEVDSQGRWFARQLNADSTNVIYDLDLKVDKGEVTRGNRVKAIGWGDVHEQELSSAIKKLCWTGKNSMIDYLKPEYQFMHDLVSFTRRNHHDIKDPHRMFSIHCEGRDAVEGEMDEVAKFITEDASRDFCEMVVVDSNHDNALTRWLKEADYKKDPANALFFLKCQLRKYEAIAEEDGWFHLVEWVLQSKGVPESVRFLREDESFIICGDAHGGIECGMHGHLGPNGARGTPLGLARLGRKANTGHTHSAGIRDGLYTGGTCSVMDMGYNSGPSSWSHSHVVTYPNGKRTIVTMWHGAYCAI